SRSSINLAFTISALLLCASVVVAIGTGPFAIAPQRIIEILLRAFTDDPVVGRDALVFWNLRLPRVMLGILVGAGLAVSGALMQGLFRNPLAEPGLVGVSSGSALAAAVVLVLGDRLLPNTNAQISF